MGYWYKTPTRGGTLNDAHWCSLKADIHHTHLPLPSSVGFILTSITMKPVGNILPGIPVISLDPRPPAAAAPGLAKVASPGHRTIESTQERASGQGNRPRVTLPAGVAFEADIAPKDNREGQARNASLGARRMHRKTTRGNRKNNHDPLRLTLAWEQTKNAPGIRHE